MLLVPGDYTDKEITRELMMIHTTLGEAQKTWVSAKADVWVESAVHDSGFYHNAYKFLIPTEEQRRRSRGIEDMGAAWFEWIEGRLNAFVSMVRQAFIRAAILLTWLPYMLILVIPAVFDGYVTRKIRQTNFDYTSPVVHRYALRVIWFCIALVLVLFMSPIAVQPLILPMICAVIGISLGLAFGNLQKQI